MQKRPISFLFLAMLFSLIITSCKQEKISYNEDFNEYLSAFTSGEISKSTPIIVQFANEMVGDKNTPIAKNIFSISPKVNGTLEWIDKSTLSFIPDAMLQSNTTYTIEVKLGELITDVKGGLEVFKFRVHTKPQIINVKNIEYLSSKKGKEEFYTVKGEVHSSDISTNEEINNFLAAKVDNKELDITWENISDNVHAFQIKEVRRNVSPYQLVLQINPKAIFASNTIEDISLEIPSANDFKILTSKVENQESQFIELNFSEALNESQDLSGLISLGDQKLSFDIDGNKIKIYPKTQLVGNYKLQIAAGILSASGKTLEKASSINITFSNPKPMVEWVSKGNILPNGNTMPIILKTVNLKAIDIRVTKVKAANVVQFFQNNKIAENNQLKRVGTEILRKRINLEENKELDLNNWTIHSLDLASLIKTEAGAIYEIAIGFKKEYSLYECTQVINESHIEAIDMLARGSWDSPNYNYWEEDSYYDEYENYYEQSNNPCYLAYYNSDKVISKNVLGSDLGILVKRADNDNLFVINDINTNAPLANVELEIYDYHQEIIARGKTDASGMAKIPQANLDNNKPFFVIAKKDKERGYLRIDKSSSLSLSRFDITGAQYEKGLKGFIYGERGVWRPGDDVLLTFILEDRNNNLPAQHPIQFEFRDHKNKIVTKRTIQNHVNGFYDISAKTSLEAETGTYQAIVKVGGATFTKNVKIENIKPNRLKIDITSPNNSINLATKAAINLKSAWLHGAVANGLKSNVQLELKDAKQPFEEYKNYIFQDPARNTYFEPTVIYENKLSATGEAKVEIDLEEEKENLNASGPLYAVFNTQVFETGGDFSTTQTSILAHPYSAYVGLRIPKSSSTERTFLETNKTHAFDIVSLNTQGKTLDKDLTVEVYKLSWQWWFSYERNEVPAWNGKVNASLYKTEKLKTIAGKATYNINIPENNWGRYLVRICDGSAHCTGDIVYFDWANWYNRAGDNTDEGATALNINTNKTTYQVGEDITLTIPTSVSGRALVTLENDAKILHAQWIDAKSGSTQYTIKATKEMSPNVYAYVTLLQPHSQTKNDLPIRMYGVKNIQVEDPNTILNPIITVAESLKPLQDFTVKVGEKNGGPMTYTVAIVDEGLLDITNFKTPNPWANFYKNMSLGVRTWDMYNDVIGAYGGVLKSLLSIGGDEAILKEKNKIEDRFKPVVLFQKAVTLAAGETKTHTFKMPNYVGSVRVMVVAGQKGAYGKADKSISVKQDLMALATLPRVISTEEEFSLPINIFVQNDNIKSVDITIENDNLFEVIGSNKITLAVSGKGEKTTYAKLKSKNKIGKGKVKVTAKSGEHTSYYETELAIRSANPVQSIVKDENIANGKNATLSYTPIGLAGTNTATVEVSILPPFNLKKRMEYLLRYPYGCVEQITSAAFPQVLAHHITDFTEEQKNTAKTNIESTIAKLNNYMNQDGSFSYWAGMNYSYPWANTYVTNFLLEAQKAGYTVPSHTLENALNNISNQAKNWSQDNNDSYMSFQQQAYNLYVLALANKADIAAMNRLRSNKIEERSDLAVWYLANAYALIGQKDATNSLIKVAKTNLKKFEAGQSTRTFTSTFRNDAMLLQVLVNLGETQKAKELLPNIINKLGSEEYLNTQESAFGIIALAKYVQAIKGDKFEFEYKIANDSWKTVSTDKAIYTLTLTPEEAANVEIRNKNTGNIFARLISQGSPKAGQEIAHKNGLEVNVQYLQNDKNISVDKINQSTNFVSKITIKNTSGLALSEVAMTQMLPAGWEITQNTWASQNNEKESDYNYRDIKDDRVYTFFNMKKDETKVFYIRLNATYAGKYYLPNVFVENMYDEKIQARNKGNWVEVLASK